MPPGLHLTIGTAPSGFPSIQHDLRLLKFGLLYGDGIRLCSPAVCLLYQWHALKEAIEQPPEQLAKPERAYLLVILAVALIYVTTAERSNRDAAVLRQAAWMGEMTPEAADAVKRAVQELARFHDLPEEALTAGPVVGELAEVVEALNSGVAELHPFVWGKPEDTIRSFVEQITSTVLSGDTFPLLDATTGELLRPFIAGADSEATAAAAARHVHLAARLFERLPVFESASVSELLDLRQELQRPLVRFRSAMLASADKIKAVPWEPGFAREAESLIYRDVEPAVLDLEEGVRDAKLNKHLVKRLADGEWKLAAGGVIGLGITHALGAPGIVSALVGAMAPVVPLVHGAVTNWRAATADIERHPLYFYHRLRNRPNVP